MQLEQLNYIKTKIAMWGREQIKSNQNFYLPVFLSVFCEVQRIVQLMNILFIFQMDHMSKRKQIFWALSASLFCKCVISF